jgi:hypothetical protein
MGREAAGIACRTPNFTNEPRACQSELTVACIRIAVLVARCSTFRRHGPFLSLKGGLVLLRPSPSLRRRLSSVCALAGAVALASPLVASANAALTRIAVDPFTNATSQHKTIVEPTRTRSAQRSSQPRNSDASSTAVPRTSGLPRRRTTARRGPPARCPRSPSSSAGSMTASATRPSRTTPSTTCGSSRRLRCSTRPAARLERRS